MSSVNSNSYETDNYGDYNSSETEYDNLNGDVDGASAENAGEGYGDSEEIVDPAAAKDQLRDLEKQVKTFNPEIQKELLETINSLELQIAKLGNSVDSKFEQAVFDHTLAKMAEVENQVVEFSVNGDQMTKYATKLNELEKNLDNKYLTTEERTAYVKQIKEIKEKLFKGELDLSTMDETLKPYQDRLDATKDFETEAKRTEGLGNQIASDLDQIFSGSETDSAFWGRALGGAGADALVAGFATAGLTAGVAGVASAGSMTAAAAFGVATGPIGIGIVGGIALTAGLVSYFSTETATPESGIKGAPAAVKDFDLAMGKKSGLLGSPVPGELARILYNPELSGEEQVKAMQQSLSKLPLGSQGMALSMVSTLIQTRDPGRFNFLAQHSGPVIDFMKQTLKSNETAIKTGMLPTGQYDGYKVTFGSDGKYHFDNTDTSMFKNDWDDFDKDPTAMSAPITGAISYLDSLPTSDVAEEAPSATDTAAAA